MDHHPSFIGRLLSELDADPAVAALRRRCADATQEGEFRVLRGAWTAAVLRALWRTASADLGTPARTAAGARR